MCESRSILKSRDDRKGALRANGTGLDAIAITLLDDQLLHAQETLGSVIDSNKI